MRHLGLVISKGVSYGKVLFVSSNKSSTITCLDSENQLDIFHDAINRVTSNIEEDIKNARDVSDERVVGIFEAHKHIVNDPVVLNVAKQYISNNVDALSAYKQSVNEILEKFKSIKDPYMLGRIVDIIDATDRVKAILEGNAIYVVEQHSEPRILVMKELKPSIIFSSEKLNINGFVAEKGYFTQHSGIIARSLKIPGIVYNDIYEIISEGDHLLIDGDKGELFVNPNESKVKEYLERGD